MSSATISPTAFVPPQAGDVVLCRFPYSIGGGERGTNPGPRVHPGIVLQVLKPSESAPDTPRVIVCYGCARKPELREHEVLLSKAETPEDLTESGLYRDTQFDLSQRITVPFNEDWFQVPAWQRFGYTAKVGSLTEAAVERVVEAVAQASRSRVSCSMSM